MASRVGEEAPLDGSAAVGFELVADVAGVARLVGRRANQHGAALHDGNPDVAQRLGLQPIIEGVRPAIPDAGWSAHVRLGSIVAAHGSFDPGVVYRLAVGAAMGPDRNELEACRAGFEKL